MEQSPYDQAVNHDEVVKAYTPETIAARDQLLGKLKLMREEVAAADITGTLPPRVAYTMYDDGTSVIDLNSQPSDLGSALSQLQADKIAASNGLAFNPNETMMVTFFPESSPSEDSEMPQLQTPTVKIEWLNSKKADLTENIVAFYPDGYVEYSSELSNTQYVHSPDAPEHVRTNAEPQIARTSTVASIPPSPADITDIQNTEAIVQAMATRYGLAW